MSTESGKVLIDFACLVEETWSFLFSTEEEEAENKGEKGVPEKQEGVGSRIQEE